MSSLSLPFHDTSDRSGASTPLLRSPSKANQNLTISKRIAFLTSGGDSQGMNAAIRALVRVAIYRDCEPYAVYEGYQGLVDGGSKIVKFGWNDVACILSEGGTVIQTARCKDFMTRDGRLKAAKNLVILGIDSLIVIGGDGSLTGADVFRSEWTGLLDELVDTGKLEREIADKHKFLGIVGMVGSIDNDMVGTEITIGANSALHRIIEACDNISSTACSHQRAFIVEVMGRHCGWLALMASIATSADWMFIPEAPRKPGEWEIQMCNWIKHCRDLGKKNTLIIICEGAVDTDNKSIKADYVQQILTNRLSIDTRVTTLGHVQRGGIPTAYDRLLATLQGVEAVNAVLRVTPESPSPMICMNENKITTEPLIECVKKTKAVAAAMAAKDFEQAFKLRDPDFISSYEMLKSLNLGMTLSLNYKPTGINFAVIHNGAPAGGMNSATKAIVQYCLYKGYTPYGIQNGFEGLANGQLIPFAWMDVEDWSSKGGSKLGTNRTLPTHNIGKIAYELQKANIRGLAIIGGFEAFVSLKQLTEARENYPAFQIPMICLPATISNNVPGTEFSLGSDTALNAIVSACDTIKLSASASTKRVFVVEVHGGYCGYLATMSGIAAGAAYSYIAEEGVKISDLQRESRHLTDRFCDDCRQGRIIIRNENCSKAYTAQLISSILEEESGGRYDSRCSILGHTQQGSIPSPLDRIRGTRLAVYCVDFLAKWVDKQMDEVNVPTSAVVIGIKGPHIIYTPVTILAQDVDMNLRRPKHQWWMKYRRLAKILAKYDEDEIISGSVSMSGFGFGDSSSFSRAIN